ncbi:stage III sporulation protein AF [Paenibacillus alkalitolerans]|uniref:stage III sporulation protein AF n=1 Tax=Paenibacillus alkalitolerans TaxID=2799335 RepID=UPI0018F290EA|nr:stage III sporulation protein AF [Paenibacillus alkalitolerans]
MDALAAWLKQIILVVLIATFIDLLLPNRSLQRYVKLVVSLFILMTILSPVMNLLGSNANMRMLAAAVEGWSLSGTAQYMAPGGNGAGDAQYPRTNSLPALSEVLSEGQAIGAKRDEQSLRLLEMKMESMVKEQIESQHGVAVVSADAELTLDKDRYPVVRQLNVVIGSRLEPADGTASEESGERGIKPVEPVQPVDIRIEVKPKPDNSVPAFVAEGTRSKQAEGIRREITEDLSEQWNVDKRRIRVVLQNPGDGSRE